MAYSPLIRRPPADFTMLRAHDAVFAAASPSVVRATASARLIVLPIALAARCRAARSRSSPICCGRPGAGGAERAGPPAGQRRRHAVQRADDGDPHEDPAPLRAAGTHRSQLPFPRWSRPMRRNMSAPTPSKRAMQPIDRIFLSIAAHHDSLAPDSACAPSIRAISSRPQRRATDGLTMRAFRDGTPYGSEDSVLRRQAPPSPRAARAMPRPLACA